MKNRLSEDSPYFGQDAGFDEYIHFKHFQQVEHSTARSRLYIYHRSNIAGIIYPGFTKMINQGNKLFEIPYHLSKYATMTPIKGVEPSRMILDFRDALEKKNQ